MLSSGDQRGLEPRDADAIRLELSNTGRALRAVVFSSLGVYVVYSWLLTQVGMGALWPVMAVAVAGAVAWMSDHSFARLRIDRDGAHRVRQLLPSWSRLWSQVVRVRLLRDSTLELCGRGIRLRISKRLHRGFERAAERILAEAQARGIPLEVAGGGTVAAWERRVGLRSPLPRATLQPRDGDGRPT